MTEKRKHHRMAVDYEVFIRHPGGTSLARARDISTQGIGLYATGPLNNGDLVDLTIVLPKGAMNLSVKGAVRYCMENTAPGAGPHRYLAGIEFTEDTKDEVSIMDIQGDVMSYQASHSVSINAPADKCYELICDFERYPQWAGVLKGVRVEDAHPDGRARRVEFEVDVYIRKVRYVLDYSYDDENLCLSWVSAGGDFVSITGRYFFKPLGENKASSTYEATAAFEFFLPNRIVRYFSRVAMRKTMKEFKSFVEKGGG
jgi:uncharacterized membrane protein